MLFSVRGALEADDEEYLFVLLPEEVRLVSLLLDFGDVGQ